EGLKPGGGPVDVGGERRLVVGGEVGVGGQVGLGRGQGRQADVDGGQALRPQRLDVEAGGGRRAGRGAGAGAAGAGPGGRRGGDDEADAERGGGEAGTQAVHRTSPSGVATSRSASVSCVS